MTPEALAALHARAFEMPRPWSAAEFAGLLADPATLLLAAPEGFALGRVAGPEAELMTLAVHPDARRRGVGRALVIRFEAAAGARGATEALLEVAVTNVAGRALYEARGFATVGRRRGYFRPPDGLAVDALVMRKPLGHATETD